jgi:hypothetical protein
MERFCSESSPGGGSVIAIETRNRAAAFSIDANRLVADLCTAYRFSACAFLHAKLIVNMRRSAGRRCRLAGTLHASDSLLCIGIAG